MIDISFIIPAYNEQKYLPKCLDSILAELKLHPEISSEVIMVNNASTDNTKNIALSFPSVKVIDEQKKGLVFAREAGAKVASGQLFAHIDADMVLPKGWLQTVLAEFAKDQNLVSLSGPHVHYDYTKAQQFWVKFFYSISYFFYLINRYVLRLGGLLQGGNFVVRAWAWKKIGETSSDFNFYGEDTELGRRLSKIGGVKFTFKLPILTTARRFKKEGLVRIGLRYALNYFSVLFFKKPATKKYQDIRPA